MQSRASCAHANVHANVLLPGFRAVTESDPLSKITPSPRLVRQSPRGLELLCSDLSCVMLLRVSILRADRSKPGSRHRSTARFVRRPRRKLQSGLAMLGFLPHKQSPLTLPSTNPAGLHRPRGREPARG
eukprot:1720858-Rhodomonas_salina.1